MSAAFQSNGAEDDEQSSDNKKRKAQGKTDADRPTKKLRTNNGAVDSDMAKPVTFLTLFDTLLKVRFCVMRRMGGFGLEGSYFCGDDVPGLSHESICKDWKLARPRLW